MEQEQGFQARDAFCQITLVRYLLHLSIRDLSPSIPSLNEFSTYENELRLLHAGIVGIVTAINVPTDPLVELGLRMFDDSWENQPQSSSEGFEEVRRVLLGMEDVLNDENGQVNVPDHKAVIFDHFSSMLTHFQSNAPELQQYVRTLNYNSYVDIGVVAAPENQQRVRQGATPEQIQSIPVHTATKENDGTICSICLEGIVEGEPIKFLPCSHSFHENCIDQWLPFDAICPTDRSIVFRLGSLL